MEEDAIISEASGRHAAEDAPEQQLAPCSTSGQEDGKSSLATKTMRSCGLPRRPMPAVERNFVQYYATDVGGIEGHDHYLYRHANGLVVVGMAPSHTALKEVGKDISAVDFDVGKKNRCHLEVSGKHKKNAQVLEANSAICKVAMSDGSSFIIRCCVRGALLEVNERHLDGPALLRTRAHAEGFLAILMPRPEDWNRVEKNFLTREEFYKARGLL